MKKILLLFGGNSSEHQISCKSAQSLLRNIDSSKYDITAVGITKKNEWFEYHDSINDITNPKWYHKKVIKIESIISFIKQFDIVFPLLHGTNGEDGKIQAMLELFHIPYVGCNPKISSIGMDKHYSKILLSHFGLPVVPFILYNEKLSFKEIEQHFSYPIIIKPCNGGSSIGVSTAHNRKELKKGIKEALSYDKKVLLEPFLNMRELECAVLQKKDKWVISPLGEIQSEHTFYDFEAKYEDSSSKAEFALNLPDKIENEIKNIAKEVCEKLELQGLSRIDFFYIPENNKIYINEINTIPGFTTISMYPKLLTTEKFTYKDLITTLLENAHY